MFCREREERAAALVAVLATNNRSGTTRMRSAAGAVLVSFTPKEVFLISNDNMQDCSFKKINSFGTFIFVPLHLFQIIIVKNTQVAE